MNKTEFVKEISKKSKLTQKDCNNCLNAITKIIENSLKRGDNINLGCFGKFEVKLRMAGRGAYPQTGALGLLAAGVVAAL